MNPDDLFKATEFPDDLKWVAAHYRLNPADPVYLLLAWHWRRMKQSEDVLKTAALELKAAVDGRIDSLEQTVGTVAGINDALGELQTALEEKPAEFGRRFEGTMGLPLAEAVKQLKSLEKTVAPLAALFAASQRRELLAVFVVGVCFGVLGAVAMFLA